MPFDRAQALLEREKIIEELNAMNDKRTELKILLDELNMICESEPTDNMGEKITPTDLDKRFNKIKEKRK